MTRISKILAVLTVAASLLFLGIAAAVLVGGHNWRAEIADLPEYVFEEVKVEGQPSTWTVTRRQQRRDPNTGSMQTEQVATNVATLPEAVVKARDHQLGQQREELDQLNAGIPRFEALLKEAADVIQSDLEAIERREQELRDELAALHDQVEQTSREGIAKAEEAQAVRLEAEQRRGDVFRLRNQLAEIRTDRFRALDQQRKLDDLLHRMRGDNDRLERRRDGLVSQGGVIEYEEPPAAETDAAAAR